MALKNFRRFGYACSVMILSLLTMTDYLLSGASAAQPLLEERSRRPLPATAVPTTLTASPTDDEFATFRYFLTSLKPSGKPARPGENAALAQALRVLPQQGKKDAIASLRGLVNSHAGSRWEDGLRYQLAEHLFNAGYFSQADSELDTLWKQCKGGKDSHSAHLAEATLIKLLDLNMGWGRKPQLEALLAEIENRDLSGPVFARVERAREVLWHLNHKVVQNVLCGPVAFYAIKEKLGQPYEEVDVDDLSDETIKTGLCSKDLVGLAPKLGLNYRLARRLPGGAAIPTPAVVHWKAGHYAALTEEKEGMYLVDDRPLAYRQWVPLDALEADSSGVFLIPAGALPQGWVTVTEAESKAIFGRHCSHTRSDGRDGTGDYQLTCGDGKTCGDSPGMASYSFHTMIVSLTVRDTPISYAPPVGPPIRFAVAYKQMDEQDPPASRFYSNLGPLWSFNYLGYLTPSPGPFNGTNSYTGILCTLPNGGREIYVYDAFAGLYSMAPEYRSFTRIRLLATNSFERVFPDGSREIYSQPNLLPNPTRLYLTAIEDAAGNRVALSYDTNLRITNIVDAIGQTNVLAYGLPGSSSSPDFYKITRVTDPFGRFAAFQYNATGLLTNITDVVGIKSSFAYGTSNLLSTLTTPYGTTSFRSGPSLDRHGFGRWLEATDPLGRTERLERFDPPDGTFIMPETDPHPPAALVNVGGVNVPFNAGNENLHFRNSYYWDHNAYKEWVPDVIQSIPKAEIFHWLVSPGGAYTVTGVLESHKKPLESRVWFNYLGQGSGEGSHFTGSSSLPSKVARVLDDGSTQLYQYEYNSAGRVKKNIDPLGRTFTYVYSTNLVDLLEVRQTRTGNELLSRIAYNQQHLPTNIVDAAGQTNVINYNSRGQVLTARNPLGEITTYNYDAKGYLLGIDGPLVGTNDQTRLTYDALGRVRTVTGSDGYTLTLAYDAMNRLTTNTYPDGSFEARTYSNLDLVTVRDRLGRISTRSYDAARQLVQTVDPLLRTNRFEWCSCGALETLYDPLGRYTRWSHDIQSRLIGKEYADGSRIAYGYETNTSRLKFKRDEQAQVANYAYFADGALQQISYSNAVNFTPAVSFGYDTNYSRGVSMQDGIGATTWSYVPVGVPGALQLASVDGPWANDTVTYAYDALSRATNRSINGTAQTAAFDAAGRPLTVSNLLGAFTYAYVSNTFRVASSIHSAGLSTLFTYLPNNQDRRLARIRNLKPDGITPLSTFDYSYYTNGNIQTWTLQNDNSTADTWELAYDNADQLATAVVKQGPTTIKSSVWEYDPAANRKKETINGATAISTYNPLNELTHASTTNTAATYEWDAENRLTAVNQGTARSEFTYDGLGRRVRITEKTSGTVISTASYLWCGLKICERRDATGANVQQRYFFQGFQGVTGTPTGAHLYTKDHLGSIREVVDPAGTIKERINYDAWGQPSLTNAAPLVSFAFTGHFWHEHSGLHLAPYRAYSANQGRWLSRDPVGERGHINLYWYALNAPVRWVDPDGREVYVCKRPIDADGNALIQFNNDYIGVTHWFIVTGEKEAGLGPEGGGPLPAFPYGSPTAINDHTGQSSQSSCERVNDVNEACVNQALQIGRPMGPWTFGNQCHSFVNDIISQCSDKQSVAGPLYWPGTQFSIWKNPPVY